MPDAQLSASIWDALRQLAFEDGERVAVTAEVARAREHAARDSLLEAARERYTAAELRSSRAASARRALEATVEDTNLRIARTNSRLASGRLQSEREVGAAQTELDALQVALAAAEESWLSASAEEETSRAAQGKASADLQREERASVPRQSAAAANLKEVENRLTTIDAVRRDAAAKLPADVRDRYRALFSKTGGRPFAHAVAGECSNCHRSVPAAAVQMLRSGTGVPSCPSCSRMLLPP
jgi:predicted  nucleic acid-binding Zn-ribbon protein